MIGCSRCGLQFYQSGAESRCEDCRRAYWRRELDDERPEDLPCDCCEAGCPECENRAAAAASRRTRVLDVFDGDQVLLVLPGIEGGWTIVVTRNAGQQFTARATLDELAITVGPRSTYDAAVAELYLRLERLKRALAFERLIGAAASARAASA